MDVTNPGLVNVAGQVAGNPATSVDSMSKPLDNDVLTPVSGEGYPLAEEVSLATDAADTIVPTATTHSTSASEAPPRAKMSVPVVPGTAPLYAPFPAPHNEVVVGLQDVPQAGTAEFTVAGPRTSIQTNQNPEVERDYVVASVLDADTGGAVSEPAQSLSGTFAGVFDQTTKLRFAASSAFPASLVDGVTMGIDCPTQPSYSGSGQTSTVVNTAGNIAAVTSAGGGASITVTASAAITGGVAADSVAFLASTVPQYNGAHKITSVTNLSGSFTGAKDTGTGSVAIVGSVATGLAVGNAVTLSGIYGGPHTVASVTDYTGAYQSATDAGGGAVTFHVASMPAGMANGQFIILTGAVYVGTLKISNVTANSFDCSPSGGYSATDTGTFTSRTFTFVAAYAGNSSGTWTCRTFDVAVAYVSTATGTWTVANFDLLGTYVATATGSWTYYPTNQLGTARYKLGLLPADLNSFGVSLQGREVTFADPTLTAADSGATRIIQFAGSNFIVVGKYDEEDLVPIMTTPQAGDELTLFVQREGSELFVEQLGQVVTVNPMTAPPVFVPSPAPPSFVRQGEVNATTGTQPNQPIIASGVQVPTAVNVNVADQATVVGLPANVFA